MENLNLKAKEQQEISTVESVMAVQNKKIDALLLSGALCLKLTGKASVEMFTPSGIFCFGDGRLLHQNFVAIKVPSGTIEVNGDLAFHDLNSGLFICRAAPYQIIDNRLQIDNLTLKISLVNVRQTQDQMIQTF